MKYIVTSKTSRRRFLIDDKTDAVYKELIELIQSSENGPFSAEPCEKDLDNEKIGKIYLEEIQKKKT